MYRAIYVWGKHGHNHAFTISHDSNKFNHLHKYQQCYYGNSCDWCIWLVATIIKFQPFCYLATFCNIIVELLTVSAKEQEKEKNTMIGDKDKMNNEEIKSKKVKGDKGKKDAKVKRVANTGNQKTYLFCWFVCGMIKEKTGSIHFIKY